MATDRQLEISPTIKNRLMHRFIIAKKCAGKDWRKKLMSKYSFYVSAEGQKYITSVAQAVSDPHRGNVDRIERVVLDLEDIAGIPSHPIA